MRRHARTAVFAATLFAAITTAGAQVFTIEDPTSSPPLAATGLGGPAAFVGDSIVLAEGANLIAALHQFDAATGVFIRTLATDAASSITAFGDDILVGFSTARTARLYDADTGAVLQTFTPPASPLQFGYAVAAAGPDVLVSSPWNEAVYRFDAATGALLQTYVDPAPDTGGWRSYGATMTAVGSLLLVGDPTDDVAREDAGAIYVFDLASGALVRTLVNPQPGIGLNMGASVVVRDGVVWTGASNYPNGNKLGGDVGVVLRFDLASGTLLQALRNPSPEGSRDAAFFGPDLFGALVQPLGSLIAVAPSLQQNFNGAQRGLVLYVYDADGALLETVRPAGILPAFLPNDEGWAYVLAASGSRFIIGRLTGWGTYSPVVRMDVVGPCGNGVVDAGEQCDDGNLLGGDCCSATCQLTVPAACRPALPGFATLTLKRTAGQKKDMLSFGWRGGDALDPIELGTPLAGTDYAVCIIEDVAGTPSLRLSALAPATEPCPQEHACWKTSASGVSYKGRATEPDGIKSLSVKAGTLPRAAVAGQGPLLGLRPMPIAGALTVRLQRRDAPVCFEATFGSDVLVNTVTQYRARSD